MKTNLIFKKTTTIEGEPFVVTRIVPVEITGIDRGEGWILSGHTDCIEMPETTKVLPFPQQVEEQQTIYETIIKSESNNPVMATKFESDVKGTAKLVRSKGVIKIVARRGKTTYNQTTPNSVCINDFTKNEFFKNCREFHGNTGCFEFKLADGKPYDYWNAVIDKEYERQKAALATG